MTNTATVNEPNLQTESRVSIQSFFRDSYSQAKQQLQDGMSAIRDEFRGMYDKAGSILQRMAMPVNNFLKDAPQIETEFRHELSKDIAPFHATMLTGTGISIEQALHEGLEENY